ncbi:MAG TPA: hypothetical protein PLH18_01180, partial [Clostridia bacterium]|nr:hypothetical protein [Clostridia bacterium]
MANRIKATLLALLLAIITSCSNSGVNTSETPNISNADKDTFFIKSIVWTEDEFYKNTDSWEQYIKDTFDISIKVKQIIRNPMEPFNFH